MPRKRSIWHRDLIPARWRPAATVLLALCPLALTAWLAVDLVRDFPGNQWSDWLCLAAAAVVSSVAALGHVAAHMRRRRLQRRFAQGLCFRCAYDLRGCTSVTCPECGAFLGTRKHAKPLDV